MRILFLTFYFPPDLSAGSFRSAALVEKLQQRAPAGVQIDVVTTQPNRYASMENSAPEIEEGPVVSVKRVVLPPHRSGMADQARAYLAFDRAVSRLVRDRRYDLVYATSSRLMTAFLGARIAARLGVPLYLDIRDIFVDTIKDVLPGIKGKVFLPFFNAIERYTFRRADRINLVSEGFGEYFNQRYPEARYDYFTNGIDEEFLSEDFASHKNPPAPPKIVLYAGNIGEGQGLHRIIPRLAQLAGDGFRFVVIGDGGRKQMLADEVKQFGLNNVEFRNPVKRGELMVLYRDADVLFLHLNDYEAFAKVLPSKLFEYAATGKPMLAGVGGYAAKFLQQEVENCGVFAPCDAEAGLAALKALRLESESRREFVDKFARSKIMDQMANAVLETASTAKRPLEGTP